MACLRNPTTGELLLLTGEHTIGRSSSCLLVLEDPRASGHHAVLSWTGQSWELRDLGSRNGTWLDGHRLLPGQRLLVNAASKIAFGSFSVTWEVVDIAAPELMARSTRGEWAVARDGVLLLPEAQKPEVIIYGDDRGSWVAERGAELVELELRREIEVAGGLWTVYPPSLLARTHTATSAQPLVFEELKLVFLVSQDEEHVELELRKENAIARMPHRAQHYLLLTLARFRHEDATEGLPESEQGWRYRDLLCRGLAIPDLHFNVSIFRARQHLRKAGVVGAKKVIERRRGSGQLRLGTASFEIERL